MWIKRWQYDRLQEKIDALERQVDELKRHVYYRSSDDGELYGTYFSHEIGVTMCAAVNALGKHVGYKWLIKPGDCYARVANPPSEGRS